MFGPDFVLWWLFNGWCGVWVFSSWSETASFFTSGSVPSQPDPPMLSEQFVYGLTISWIKRPNEDEFLLQMEDEATVSGLGGLPSSGFSVFDCLLF